MKVWHVLLVVLFLTGAALIIGSELVMLVGVLMTVALALHGLFGVIMSFVEKRTQKPEN